MELDSLLRVRDKLLEDGDEAGARAVQSAALKEIDTSYEESLTTTTLISGMAGVLLGTLVISGAWIPLGLVGAGAGALVAKRVLAAKKDTLRKKVYKND